MGRYYLDDRTDYLEDAKAATKDAKDAFRRRKALEKAKKDLEPIVDFEALFIPDEWSRVGLIAPALAVEDIITNTCDAKEIEKLKKTTGKTDIHTVTLLGGQGWNSPKNAEGVPRLIERGGKFVLCSVFVDGFYAESNREATRRFVHAYTEAYPDATPLLLDAVAYDSAGIIPPGAGRPESPLEAARPCARPGGGEGLRRGDGEDELQRAARSGKAALFPHHRPKGRPRNPAPGASPWLVKPRNRKSVVRPRLRRLAGHPSPHAPLPKKQTTARARWTSSLAASRRCCRSSGRSSAR